MLSLLTLVREFRLYFLGNDHPFSLDLPRGPIKNNSMRKLAAKTLMEILPENISKLVHDKLEEQGVSPEFLTLIGLVSYYTDTA